MTEQDKSLKETIRKLASSVPTQTKEHLNAKRKFDNETNELIERFANIGKMECIRGQRVSLPVCDDYLGVPKEIIDEVCKPLIENKE